MFVNGAYLYAVVTMQRRFPDILGAIHEAEFGFFVRFFFILKYQLHILLGAAKQSHHPPQLSRAISRRTESNQGVPSICRTIYTTKTGAKKLVIFLPWLQYFNSLLIVALSIHFATTGYKRWVYKN